MTKHPDPDPLSYNEILAYQYVSHDDGEQTSDSPHQAIQQKASIKLLVVAAVAAVMTATATTLTILFIPSIHKHRDIDASASPPRPSGSAPSLAPAPIPFPMVTRINGLYRIVHHKNAVVTQSPLPDHNTLTLDSMDEDEIFVSAFTTHCTQSECILTRYSLNQNDTSKLADSPAPLQFRLTNGQYMAVQPVKIRVMGHDTRTGQPCEYSEEKYGTYNAPSTPDRFDGFFTEEVTSDGCLTKGAKGVSKIDAERIGDLPLALQARLSA
jgi:hypothetical protein